MPITQRIDDLLSKRHPRLPKEANSISSSLNHPKGKRDEPKAKVAYVAKSSSSSSCALVVSHSTTLDIIVHLNGKWIANSGASSHMTHSSSHLENYKSLASLVCIGDDSSLLIIGIVNVPLGDASLKEVLHVPRLTTNLFSISKATSKGLGVYFDDDVIEVIDRQSLSIVVNGYQSDGLYYISSFDSQFLLQESHLHQLFAPSKAPLSK